MRKILLILSIISSILLTNSLKAEAMALTDKQQNIITIAAFTASGDLTKLDNALNQGLDAGLTINEAKEILIQMYAYAGFPRSLNGINTLMSVLEKRKAKGIKDIQGEEKYKALLNTAKEKDIYGNKVRAELIGIPEDAPVGAFAQFAPRADEFLKQHLFADIFVNEALNYQERELATISALATIEGAEPQLAAHLQFSRNVGISDAELLEFIKVLEKEVSPKTAVRTESVLNKILGKEVKEKEMDIKIVKSGTNPDVKGNAENFSGDVTISTPFKGEGESRIFGATVTFAPGARTAWHDHEIGQMLLILSGKGLIQKEGEVAQEISEGDVVWIPAHIKHWHGATEDSAMSHVAIVENLNGKNSTWMELVSDKQYKGE